MQAVSVPKEILPADKFTGKGYVKDGAQVSVLSAVVLCMFVLAVLSSQRLCTVRVRSPALALSSNSHNKEDVQYKEMYHKSVTQPEEFWAEIAEEFTWKDKVRRGMWPVFHNA